jgi:hypothetical protein
MVQFQQYYAALLRGRHVEPRAEEALRDYVDMIRRIQPHGVY